MATSLNNLAGLYQAQGRYAEAEPLLQQALELTRSLLGEQHPAVAASLNNLAGLYQAQGRYEEAGGLYQQAIAIATQTLGLNHPYTQGFQQNFQSMILGFLNSLPLEAALERLPPEAHEAYRQMRES